MRSQGKITHWNEEKGYGFITPANGTDDVFVHIRAFANKRRSPELNQRVKYSLSTDNQGRPCAVKVTRKGEKQPSTRKRSIFKILLGIGFLAAVGISVKLDKMHIYVFYLYLGVSALTFLLYAKDKWAAKRDAWRTPEGTLQGLALIGEAGRESVIFEICCAPRETNMTEGDGHAKGIDHHLQLICVDPAGYCRCA